MGGLAAIPHRWRQGCPFSIFARCMSKKKPENYGPEPAEQRDWSTPEEVAELLTLEDKWKLRTRRYLGGDTNAA